MDSSTETMAIRMLITSFIVLLSVSSTQGDANDAIINQLVEKNNNLAEKLIKLEKNVQKLQQNILLLEEQNSKLVHFCTHINQTMERMESEINEGKALHTYFVKKGEVQQLKSELNITKHQLRNKVQQQLSRHFVKNVKVQQLKSELNVTKYNLYSKISQNKEKLKHIINTICGNCTHIFEKYDSLQCDGKELLCTECQAGMYLENNMCVVDYAALHDNTYREVQRVQVVYASRLHGTGSELWMSTGDDTLYVYTQTLTLLRSVTLEGVWQAFAVVPIQSGQLMVAAYNGLHLLHMNGSHVQTLQTRQFRDVVVNQNVVYGLTWEEPSHVYIYQYQKEQWVRNSSVTLEFGYTRRLAVYNHTLYVTYEWKHPLYHYSLSGEPLGVYGSGERGALKWPDLCHTDTAGNVLIADVYNHRLQVYSPHTREWTTLSLTENMGKTRDAVVSEDGQTIWVLEWNLDDDNYHIVKYNKE